MVRLHKDSQAFKEWGRRGGLKRAQQLSASVRMQIAFKAAQTRWGKNVKADVELSSVRLDLPQLTHPVFLEELLSTGSLEQWSVLYQEISDHPFGLVSQALEKVLSSTYIYGVTFLWTGLLRNVRGSFV